MSAIRPFKERQLRGADGETIAVADWPGERGPLVCVHGLTSSSRAFAGLAAELPDYRIVAMDCRGRGGSSKKGPFGMRQHAADLVAVMDGCGLRRATLVGHSMGAYVVSAFCAEYPDRVDAVVFVDGGYFLEYPATVTPDGLMRALLGPFLEKLHRTWTSFDEYVKFYESTALYPIGVDEYGRAHFAFDLQGDPPMLRSRIVEACVAPDWREVLDHGAASQRLDRIKVPLLLLRAPGGLTGTGDQVVPDAARDAILRRVPQAKVVDVAGTNHHTILFSVAGARVVARAITDFTAPGDARLRTSA